MYLAGFALTLLFVIGRITTLEPMSRAFLLISLVNPDRLTQKKLTTPMIVATTTTIIKLLRQRKSISFRAIRKAFMLRSAPRE